MKQVLKFAIDTSDTQVIQIPIGAVILTVQIQGGWPQIWACCDPEAEKEPVTIKVYGTGHDIDDRLNLDYIGTYQINNGYLVFHVFKQS